MGNKVKWLNKTSILNFSALFGSDLILSHPAWEQPLKQITAVSWPPSGQSALCLQGCTTAGVWKIQRGTEEQSPTEKTRKNKTVIAEIRERIKPEFPAEVFHLRWHLKVPWKPPMLHSNCHCIAPRQFHRINRKKKILIIVLLLAFCFHLGLYVFPLSRKDIRHPQFSQALLYKSNIHQTDKENDESFHENM